jgi:hypothetical protein
MVYRLLSVFLFLFAVAARAQYSGDVGVSMAGEESNTWNKRRLHSVSLSCPYGLSDNNVHVLQPRLDLKLNILNTQCLIRLPFGVSIGPLASMNAFGDIQLMIRRKIFTIKRVSFFLGAGTRIRTGTANMTTQYRPLPMVYQPTQGLYDLILSSQVNWKSWMFVLAYQHSFGQNNNQFLYTYWPYTNEALNYPQSNALRRGNDLSLRVKKSFRYKQIGFHVGTLLIWRISKDRFTDISPDFPPVIQEIAYPGSNGLSANITAGFRWHINRIVSIGLDAGAPVWHKKNSPDGLFRYFTVIPTIDVSF